MKKLPPKKIFLRILLAIFILLLLHISAYITLLLYNLDPESFFFRKLNFNEERNLPALFSTMLHFTASYFLAVIALSKLKITNRRWFWGSLSAIFIFLGLDEMFTIHEKLSSNIYDLEENAIYFYDWVFIYIAALVLLAVIFSKPLLSLPKKTLMTFIFAGFVFVFGAVVLETIAANIVFKEGLAHEEVTTKPIIFVLATFEELLEMLGVAIFIYALLDFLNKYRLTTGVEKNTLQN